MSAAWYRDPTSEERTAHRGTVARGRVTPACHSPHGQGTFPSYGARVEGEPAAEDICPLCPPDAVVSVQAGRAAAPARGPRLRWPVCVGPVEAALAGAVLLVVALALVTYLAWPR